MGDAEQALGRFKLKVDDEISFVIPGEEGEFNGIIVQISAQDGAPALTMYLPDFPSGRYVTVLPGQVTAKILYSNVGLSRFEVADKVEYYNEKARRICSAWVYEIDQGHREIVIVARDKIFSRLPEELRIVPPPRSGASGTERRETDESSDQR